MDEAQQILKQYWGYDTFRDKQLAVIKSVLSKKDTLVLMPTGGGKSLCFQIPALINEGICIVVSPLLALMEDQVAQLQSKGIKAMHIPGGTSLADLDVLLNNCTYGNYKFLYVSPERLQNELVRQRIQKMNVSLLAIDEAHCISEWGHDFRPSYIKLAAIRELLPQVPVIALTATATKKVQKDIVTQLGFEKHELFQTSYKRENLSYGIYKTQDKKYLLQQIFAKQKGAAIVYVSTRKATENLVKYLQEKNILSLPYHGGLDSKAKQLHFQQWRDNVVQVIVATNAFGMGIDKSDVRTVIHMHIPQSIEGYFQEAGRAGRDGERAYALLLQTGGTVSALKDQFAAQTPDIDFVKFVYRKLSSYFQISYGEGENETHTFIFRSFCERYKLSKAKVYASLKILDKNGIIIFSEKYTHTTNLQVLISVSQLNHFAEQNPVYDALLSALARMYSGVFTNLVTIDLGKLAQTIQLSQDKVTTLFEKLKGQEVILFENKKYDSSVEYLQPREDDLAINAVSKYIKTHLRNRSKKITDVITFVENNDNCKSKQLLRYFGETSEDCGICSVCVKKQKQHSHKESTNEMEAFVVQKLEKQAMDSRSIFKGFAYTEADLIRTLRSLLEKEIILLLPNNTYKLK